MKKILKSLLFLTALIPLVPIDKFVFFPYTSPKVLFFRSIIIIVSLIFIYSFIFIDKFRDSIIEKLKSFFKNPPYVAILSFTFLVGVSALFAVDKNIAFWGGIERAEGLSAFIYYFVFLNFLVLFFEKKDWLNFFKLNILVSVIVLSYQLYQFLIGMGRPGPFFGNPTFLAGYMIFSIIFSVIVFSQSKSKFWKYLSIFSIIFSIFGIFIAETRGTIVGLALGIFAALVYGIIKGKNVNYKKFNLRKTSIIILSLAIIFSGVFISTRKSDVWQKVPGLSRMAVISLDDSTTSTRLLNQQTSLKSINPALNSIKYLIFGYGQDNFRYAYGKYFNPVQFDDEMVWFDRSHNKFLDVLVMNGVLGLIAYLSIFIILFRYIARKDFSLVYMGVTFGIVAYLGHLFFVFDQVTTYIPLFMLFAFIVDDSLKLDSEKKINNYVINIIILFIFIASSIFIYFRNDLIAYIQMRNFVSLIDNDNKASIIIQNIDSSLYPFTNAQAEIREKMFKITQKNLSKESESLVDLAGLSLEKGEEYLNYNSFDYVFLVNMANDYTNKGKKLGNNEFLKNGEKYFRRLIDFSPYRPDANSGLGINLFYQKNYGESFDYMEKSFRFSEKYYEKNKENVIKMYPLFLKYFIQNKNLENLKIVSDRLSKENYEGSEMLKKLIDYIEKTNTWPPVRFN